MRPVVMFLSRTWLATTLFFLVAVAIYWGWLSWESARFVMVPTALLSPITWWLIAGRKSNPSLARGFLAGAVVGPVTQALPSLLPEFLRARSPAGLGNGEDQAVSMVTVFFYLVVGICSIPIGGVVGLIAVVLQRRIDPRTASPGEVRVSESGTAEDQARRRAL